MIAPDDPRHGTHAGYMTGCDCADCALGHYRANKERNLYRSRHGSCRVDHERLLAVVKPWLLMGLSPHAITQAAGFPHRTDLREVLEQKTLVNRATFQALANVTEADFSDTAKVYADLTRKRIFSLMVAGHPLKDMPVKSTGYWRTREYITVDQARRIRDYYAAMEFKLGSSRLTAARALNAGHKPPLAWDDPRTLAWPKPPAKTGCGTRPGYVAHLRAGETTCAPCRAANTNYRAMERRKEAA